MLFRRVFKGVDIWQAELAGEGNAGPEGLPGPDQERFGSFLREQPRRRWLASRWAVRRVLAGYLGQAPGEIEIVEGENGKPRLPGGELQFNLSHSGDLALIAVSEDRPVGVDLERLDPARDFLALAERALDQQDLAAVRAVAPGDRPGVFYPAWVRHEARLKCLGAGLTGPFPDSPVAVLQVDAGPGYAAAVAVAGAEAPPLRLRTLPPG